MNMTNRMVHKFVQGRGTSGRYCRDHRAARVALFAGIVVMACRWPGPVYAGAASAQMVEQQGRKVAVLENDWIRMTVDPAKGGRVSSFIAKRLNREMITNPSSGLFMDHFYEQNWPGEFLDVPYEVEVVEAGPTQASVRVSRTSTGNWAGSINAGVADIRIIRTLSLAADRPVVECEVELKNTATASKAFTFWQQHVYRADGDSGPESRQVMTRPSAGGLHVVVPANDWTREPQLVAGWTAGIDPKDRIGLAFLMDYNSLWALYNCGLASSEYFFDKILLPGTMSWTTRSTAVLVEGLETVVYASPHLAADIKVTASNGALCVEHVLVAPAAPLGRAKVTTTLAWLNRSLAIGTQPSVSEVGGIGREPQRVTAVFPGQAGKPLIIQVGLEGSNWKESYEFAYSGSGSGKEQGKTVEGYAAPVPPKERQIIKPPVLTKVKNEQPRIMHLRGLYYKLWHVEEAAQALGPHELLVSWYKDVGDIQMLSVPPWDYEAIMKQDVIIFDNIAYGAMVGEQGAGMLKAYVENGGSVLFIGGPQAFGSGNYHQSAALKELLPVELMDGHDLGPVKSGELTVASGSPLEKAVAGKPLGDAFWMHQLKAKADAQVWLRAGGEPAIVARQLGKGRVAVILLTVLGEPAKHVGFRKQETPFWEQPAWSDALAVTLRWLAKGQ